LGKVSIAIKTFGVCDFSRLAVTDWRLRRWRLCFLALMTATHLDRSRAKKSKLLSLVRKLNAFKKDAVTKSGHTVTSHH